VAAYADHLEVLVAGVLAPTFEVKTYSDSFAYLLFVINLLHLNSI